MWKLKKELNYRDVDIFEKGYDSFMYINARRFQMKKKKN